MNMCWFEPRSTNAIPLLQFNECTAVQEDSICLVVTVTQGTTIILLAAKPLCTKNRQHRHYEARYVWCQGVVSTTLRPMCRGLANAMEDYSPEGLNGRSVVWCQVDGQRCRSDDSKAKIWGDQGCLLLCIPVAPKGNAAHCALSNNAPLSTLFPPSNVQFDTLSTSKKMGVERTCRIRSS